MKKKLTKVLSGISLGLMGLAPTLTASCGGTPTVKHAHIMMVSDIHGEIPGYGDDFFSDDKHKTYAGAIRMADAMQEIADKASDTLILSGGDQNSSGSFSAVTQGKTMYPVLKQMGIRYSAVGNHAWDWGSYPLVFPELPNSYDSMGRTDKTQGNYFICSNIIDNKGYRDKKWTPDKEHEETEGAYENDYQLWLHNKCGWADPYKVVELDGHKICLIGLTSKSVYTDGNQRATEDISISDYTASVNYTKRFFKEQQPELFDQIDSFILLTHLGTQQDGAWVSGDAADVANEMATPIDAVLAAHTHTDRCCKIYNNKIDRPITIVETKDRMQDFADLELVFDDTKPVGSRLKEINAKIITPNIDSSSRAAAKQQIDNIVANPRNEVVKNVCTEYAAQKAVAKKALQTPIGNTANGLDYLQSEDLYAYYYPQDFYDPETGKYESKKNCLVEQAGALAAKAEICGFNNSLTKGGVKPVNISYITNTSIQTGIAKGEIDTKDMYSLFPYDEYAVSITLTYHQLKQLCRYMLTGKKLETEPRLHEKYCTDSYTVEEGAEGFTPIQHRYPYGANQFYGFRFGVHWATSTDTQYRRYDSDFAKGSEEELFIYNPDDNTNEIDDPSTWTSGEDYWKDKPIRMVLSSFDYITLNKRNLFLPVFAEWNTQNDPEHYTIEQFTNIDVRDLCINYIKQQTEAGNDIDLSDTVCEQLIKVVI